MSKNTEVRGNTYRVTFADRVRELESKDLKSEDDSSSLALRRRSTGTDPAVKQKLGPKHKFISMHKDLKNIKNREKLVRNWLNQIKRKRDEGDKSSASLQGIVTIKIYYDSMICYSQKTS